ncbi:MAG TPA: hypothetical protein VKX17_28565 [Planctomycetota bacterium]|nr:hypothetical protein [Planctomycetota bacterium]
MPPSTRKLNWWLLLVSSAVVCAVMGYCFVWNLLFGYNHGEGYLFALWFALDALLVTLSLFKLRRCYREEPSGWTGRWQLSLIDLLSIVILTGLSMALFKAAMLSNAQDNLERDHFLYEGVPISFGIGVAWTAALLFAARTGSKGTLDKWFEALGWLGATVIFGGLGFFVQLFVLMAMIRLFYR